MCYYQKITFVNLIIDLIRKVFNIGKESESQWQIHILQSFHFNQKTLILLWATNTICCIYSDENFKLTLFIFENGICQNPGLNNHSLSVSCYSK